MSNGQKKADDLMRKAAESFAGGKMQKAYKQYGMAAKAYEASADAPQERRALALYTRAMFILSGDATGDVEENLDLSDAMVSKEEFSGQVRFRGLFFLARAKWRRQHDDLEKSQHFLDLGRVALLEEGEPVDCVELDREQARLSMDQKNWQRAEECAQRSVEASRIPRQSIESRVLLSEVYRAQERMKDVLSTLEVAASTAFDADCKDELWDLQDRIQILKRNYPELEK